MAALAGIAHSGARPDGLRAAALAALARIDPATVALAASWADSARWTLRLYAATTAASAGAAAAPALERLARDSHPVVAARALAALGQLADSVPAVRRVFIEQLASPHPIVRAAATTALGRMAGPAELDLLLLAYQRSLQDTAPDAATAAVNALGRLIRAGVPADRAFFARFAQQPPGSMAVYEAIARYIGPPPAAWTPPPARPEPRPLAFYQEIVARYVAPALAGDPLPRVAIGTIQGDIVIELFAADAPLTVHNFLALVERGYYAGTRWHRVVPGFVLQDGDPRGDGSGGPGHTIRDELNRHRYHRGTVGMALSGPDTGGSQFFITLAAQPHLDAGYTIFGHVAAGMAAADRMVQDEPIHGFRRLR
jgi:cyclophilin family peptidyl-prolyl cis-trans isomerase